MLDLEPEPLQPLNSLGAVVGDDDRLVVGHVFDDGCTEGLHEACRVLGLLAGLSNSISHSLEPYASGVHCVGHSEGFVSQSGGLLAVPLRRLASLLESEADRLHAGNMLDDSAKLLAEASEPIDHAASQLHHAACGVRQARRMPDPAASIASTVANPGRRAVKKPMISGLCSVTQFATSVRAGPNASASASLMSADEVSMDRFADSNDDAVFDDIVSPA
ncbi:hypothetical protein GS444_01840, partial [Rhodococcus hoagii]|nr:hypothetical protein [Prescottella equi]